MAMPMNQAYSAAKSGSTPGFDAALKAGPMMNSTAPKVLGVSRPSGIAVTSVRPVRRARRKAIAV